jgi:Protein of unknown function (DUF3631)
VSPRALSGWSIDALKRLATRPELPHDLYNRVADAYRPLISIADDASPELGQLARQAAVAMSKAYKSITERLYRDIQTVMTEPTIRSLDLIDRLLQLPDGEWGECRGEHGNEPPRPLNPRLHSNLLRSPGFRRFGIRARTIRVGHETIHGYRREWFLPVWRYLDGADEEQPTRHKMTVVRGGRRD